MTRLFGQTPAPMLQKIIDMPSRELGREYTCSIVKCADGRLVGPFTARRTIHGGHSQIVEVAQFAALHPLLLAIGTHLDIVGSLNVQLMIGAEGPVPFELNARFSGTTAIRAYFGFNEPEMVLRSYFLGEEIPQPEIRSGLSFRYDEHVFLDGVSADALGTPFPKGEVVRWF
jgi:carbamoyl-phosphate synthase large subunit